MDYFGDMELGGLSVQSSDWVIDMDYFGDMESEGPGLNVEGMEELIQSSEDQMISPTGLQAEASRYIPRCTKPIPIEKGAIEELRHRGITLIQAAKELGVSPSTLKRKCRDHGITGWRSANTQPEYTMTVVAECGGLWKSLSVNSNTGLETLRKQLKGQFVLQTRSFLIDYKFDNRWYGMKFTSDLKLHMDELHRREEGQRTMVLRVTI